jgi:hypothetical protein
MPLLVCTEPAAQKTKKTLKVENWWMLHEGFKDVCQQAINLGAGQWTSTVRAFRKVVTQWQRRGIPTPNKHLRQLEEQMNNLQLMPPNDTTNQQEKNLQLRYNDCLAQVEVYWGQRSRLRWATYGDKNTSFYHASVVAHRRKNQIPSILLPDDTWITDDTLIRAEFIRHFREIYCPAGSDGHQTHSLLTYHPRFLPPTFSILLFRTFIFFCLLPFGPCNATLLTWPSYYYLYSIIYIPCPADDRAKPVLASVGRWNLADKVLPCDLSC